MKDFLTQRGRTQAENICDLLNESLCRMAYQNFK